MSKFKVGDKVKSCTGLGRITGVVVKIEETKVFCYWNHEDSIHDINTPTYMLEDKIELVTPPFQLEVGKTYIDGRGIKYEAIELVMAVKRVDGITINHHHLDGTYQNKGDMFTLRPLPVEDWRSLHYVNERASLGGESFSSETEVMEKFKNSQGFIKAVRVDA